MKFETCKKLWADADSAFLGTDGFLDGSNLDKYVREDDEKFKDRQNIAYYTNIFASKVNRYIGYIYKKLPVRNTQNQILKQILKDINNKGDNINVFMQNIATRAKVRGVGLILIDMSKEVAPNLKEQIEARLLPYVMDIPPQSVTEYRLDRFGKFEFVKFDDTIIIDDEITNITRYYDKNVWKIILDDDVIDEGEHNLGVCPLIYLSEHTDFSTIGEFTQVARLAKRHYNLQSELDEILRYQTFPILTMQGDLQENDLQVSSDSAIFYDRDVNQPQFIAPPSAPAQLYQSRIQEIENQISNICYDLSTNKSQESGIALDIKFQGLNSSLSKFATNIEDFEYRIFDIICRYLGIANDIEVNYPNTFSVIDVNKEIEVFSELKALIKSPTYFKQKAIQIISNDLTNIDIETFDIIKAELEDETKEEA